VAEIAAAWWAWLAPASLQATLLLACVWLLDRVLRRAAWTQLLAVLWLVALARLVLPPTLASPWSVTRPLGEPTLALASHAPPSWVLPLALAWAAGVLTCLGARARARRRLAERWIARSLSDFPAWRAALARAARSARVRVPRLASLEGLATPAVVGPLRPVLVLPPEVLRRAPTLHDRNALLHELVHLRRRDLWLDEACALFRALFWFHPLVWLAGARLHALAELACDAEVTRLLGRRADTYRATLLLAAREVLGLRTPGVLRPFAGRSSALRARLERLERPAGAPVPRRAAGAVLALVACACVLPMAPSATLVSARSVLDARERGELRSCFSAHAAACVVAAEDATTPPN